MRDFDSTSTTTDWDELDRQDRVDYSLATEIFEQHEYGFEEHRQQPRQQMPLDDLVHERIEGNRQSKSKLRTMFDKFLYGK